MLLAVNSSPSCKHGIHGENAIRFPISTFFTTVQTLQALPSDGMYAIDAADITYRWHGRHGHYLPTLPMLHCSWNQAL